MNMENKKQREIKFRAWDKTEQKMIRPAVEFEQLLRQVSQPNDNSLGGDAVRRHELEWMQFTGLSDKSGVEIYEGDILKSAYNGNHAVVWTMRSAHWGIDHQNDCCRPWKGPLSGHAHMEIVIGNIYENEDLLK